MFIEKNTQKNGKPHRGGMKFLIDDDLTQVGSTEKWNPKELVPNRRDEICYFQFIWLRYLKIIPSLAPLHAVGIPPEIGSLVGRDNVSLWENNGKVFFIQTLYRNQKG